MKRIVDVYVESISGSGDYSKLELFNDEKIELTSSIQNIQDISKVYTDFTQSFTIPASPINNAILHHFYQSDVDISTTNGVYQWNFNFRIRAKIEVGLTPFRTGTIMVEKSEIKNGRPDNYTITFYGDLVSLKDKFGDAKLSDLDLTSYDVSYTGANVVTKVTTDLDDNVMFPLISSQRVWTYNDGTNTDIKTTTGFISYTELTPALKVARIFDAIKSKFNVTFNSSIFVDTDKRWSSLYLLMKNEEIYTNITKAVTLDLLTPSGTKTLWYTNTISFQSFFFSPSDNYFICQNIGTSFPVAKAILIVNMYYVSDDTIPYYIDLYRNGILINTYKNLEAKFNVSLHTFQEVDNGAKFEVKVRTDYPMDVEVTAAIYYPNANVNQSITFAPVTTTSFTDLRSKAPDITIADFFSGILKMFNSTCYATSTDVFTLEPLDSWYSKGAIYDITEYTETDSIAVERQNIYKKLSFEFEKSESFMNRGFYDNFGREYANTSFLLSNEGTDFTIKLPFENLLMQNLDANVTEVGYCLTKAPDYKPYIPKPILLYKEGFKTSSFRIYDGSDTTLETGYNVFNANVTSNGVLYSNTWHPEYKNSTDFTQLNNNLYATYYKGYLNNLFNPKCRLVRVKSHFPLSLITKLKLNDRLIIRDKRYIINELKTDITNGEVDLSLINDFRPMINNAVIDNIIVDDGGDTFPIDWDLANGVSSTAFSSPTGGVSFSPSTITESGPVDITVPSNTNTPTPIVLESGTDTLITDDGWGIANEEGSNAVIPIYATNTNFDGTTSIYDFYLTQS
jgi:hypothetical protein